MSPSFVYLLMLPQFLQTTPATTTAPSADKPELLSVSRIWDQASHNAFTDLIRYGDEFLCTFREGAGHVGGNGQSRVLASRDGKTWKDVGLVTEEGIDLRDPKLSVMPDGRLMMVMGGAKYDGKKRLGFRSCVSFSPDGRSWSPPQPILADWQWLWRVTWHEGQGYGIAYPCGDDRAKQTPLTLWRTRDGLHYDHVCDLDVSDQPNESTLRFLPDGTLMALVRREAGNHNGVIGLSSSPYTKWQWREVPHRLGGPNFLQLPDGSMWATSRNHADKVTTVLARLTRDSYEPVLTFPSGGDCSYPGMVWHDGLLWIGYYSSHEGKSSIYMARVRVPQ